MVFFLTNSISVCFLFINFLYNRWGKTLTNCTLWYWPVKWTDLSLWRDGDICTSYQSNSVNSNNASSSIRKIPSKVVHFYCFDIRFCHFIFKTWNFSWIFHSKLSLLCFFRSFFVVLVGVESWTKAVRKQKFLWNKQILFANRYGLKLNTKCY